MSKQIAVQVEFHANGNVRLAPADSLAEDQMRELTKGARLNATITVSRNTPEDEHMGTLRYFMAGINELYEAVGQGPDTGPGTAFPTPRHLRKHILRELGFYVAIPQANGAVRKEVDSMALDKMELADLKTALELSRAYCLGEWGVDPWDEWSKKHPLPQGTKPARPK